MASSGAAVLHAGITHRRDSAVWFRVSSSYKFPNEERVTPAINTLGHPTIHPSNRVNKHRGAGLGGRYAPPIESVPSHLRGLGELHERPSVLGVP